MSRFLELLLAAILNLFGAEFEDVDMENIDILVGYYYSLQILSLKLFFQNKRSVLLMSLPIYLFGCTHTPLGF